MNGQLRVKSHWSQLAIFFGLLSCFLILTVAFSALVQQFTGMAAKPDLNDPGDLKTMKILQAISSVTMFAIPTFAFALLIAVKKPFSYLGLVPAEKPKMYLLAVICIMACLPVVGLLGELNHAFPLPQWMVDLEKDTSKQLMAFLKAENAFDIIINVIVMALLPAICEELCFRGALQKIMMGIFKNPWTAIIVTSIIFSTLHFQFLGFLPRLFLGIILGALYWYSGSLWTSILAHFVYNGVQVIGVSFEPKYIEENPQLPIYYSLVCLLIVVAVMWVIRSESIVKNHGS
ncbi:MAG: CPBP family intramembrane metalloprotease [Chitinophagaceae bacterium]|nr:CPBP family intramembrane metalloprotease [Chitinophagaceae bacterium]